VEGAADNEACTVHAKNIISQRQFFVASHVGNAFLFTLRMSSFSFYPQASEVGKTQIRPDYITNLSFSNH
jgi:hypothetical protein